MRKVVQRQLGLAHARARSLRGGLQRALEQSGERQRVKLVNETHKMNLAKEREMSRGAAGLKELHELHGLHEARQRAGRAGGSRSLNRRQAVAKASSFRMADTTQMRWAPAASTSSRLLKLIPPIANHGIRMFAAAQRTYSRVTG